MLESLPGVLLLCLCWIASLAILLIFLESWFGVQEHNAFVARRASGAYGICSVFFTMKGSPAEIERTVRSLFAQSYPFVELFLIYPEKDSAYAALARELRAARTHVAVRLVPVPFSLSSPSDRIRALESAQPYARGRWYALVESGLLLDRLALEASLEFSGTGEVRALALRPGMQASSSVYRILVPSMEYLIEMLRLVERRRNTRPRRFDPDPSFLLFNREAFEVVHRINRMPGILNEAGWNLWSYQIEGLRTFEGDGSRWTWSEVAIGAWPGLASLDRRVASRAAALIATTTLLSMSPVAGLAYGFLASAHTFLQGTILAVSAASYALMTIGYFLHARKLRAASWFAPFWFLAQPAAAILTLAGVRKALRSKVAGREALLDLPPAPSDSAYPARRRKSRESFRL